MQDFEKLGAFYLGKRVDAEAGQLTEEPVLYDSKDLTTHAVIVGMTGSGKTGLGIGLIEEAAIDHVPVIAIDPKGDLGNLLLTFPELRGKDFEPWVDPGEAVESGKDRAAFAADMAETWKNGLAQWGQTPDRIRKLREAAEFAIYTPGSNAGIPISVLREMAAPPAELMNDSDLYRERVQSTSIGILALAGLDVDPVTSREHILVANILDQTWKTGASLDLPGLIAQVQQPGFDKIGVMTLDAFFPPKDRFGLAMRLNNLLASPGFSAWMEGEPLDIQRLLFTPAGKPRVSVLSISHLSDPERMFFVTVLLNELIAWMRRQTGTSSLRALLYMDEIFGFMPPVANPPSKTPLLTLLKQARAFGVGLALATQNPVDLDYKGLSNAGTWFIGRLQTERDQQRLLDGLQGAESGTSIEPAALQRILSGLGKRRFLLHNVHDKMPTIFQTRWVMSYLAGPLSRDQIRTLTAEHLVDVPATPATGRAAATTQAGVAPKISRPVVPPGLDQYFLPPAKLPAHGETLVYWPRLLAAVEVRFSNAKLQNNVEREYFLAAELLGDTPDWDSADSPALAVSSLDAEPREGIGFNDCPSALLTPSNFKAWEKDLARWLRSERPLVIFTSPAMKLSSQPGESEGDFRARLQQQGNERRDQNVAKLKKKYEAKFQTLHDQRLRAEQGINREAQQAQTHKLDTAISFGTAILGAFLGRKAVSATSARSMGTAMSKAGRAREQSQDVDRAREKLAAVEEKTRTLEARFDAEVEKLEDAYDAQFEELRTQEIRPLASDIHVSRMGLGWLPYIQFVDGRLGAAWTNSA
ncbi:MAG: DUF87 domain-containing protein [Gammaproteobacteria bacterium]|nr:DUF87 domain-containing protein [Gammaproteobacteria bacterium]